MSKEPTEYCALLNQVSYYIYYRIMLISFVDIVRGKDDPVSLQSLKIDVVDITSGICLAGLVFAIFGICGTIQQAINLLDYIEEFLYCIKFNRNIYILLP
jgi:hypothetical protein